VSAALASRLTEHFGGGEGGGGGGAANSKAADGEADEERGDDDGPFTISYTEPLPLADFFGCIDEHHSARLALLAAYAALNDRAHEYRLVTKRLLVCACAPD
jgi:hypothetical protein